MPSLAALLLADSRLPTGGHAHSAGVEAAIARGLLRDTADLELFVTGRLLGSGQVTAAAAAAACLLAARHDPVSWELWDAALSARMPSAATRHASRSQGATLLRTVIRLWPSTALHELSRLSRPHHPLVLGVAVAAAGEESEVAALLALHHLLGGMCSAAVRLLGLDPITVAGVQARASEPAQRVGREAVSAAREAVTHGAPQFLPSTGTPLPEVLAELHIRTEGTLFAS
jgi:urease accessory protein